MTIGYINPEYATRRNILGKCPSCEYARIRPFKSMAMKIARLVGAKLPLGLRGAIFCGGFTEGFRHVDLYHFFNLIAIPSCKKPYVTTFEDMLPRGFPNEATVMRGLDSMMSERCHRLIAISEHARLLQVAFNRAHGADVLDDKITVLLPPQEPLSSERDVLQKKDIFSGSVQLSPFRLIFVGKDFFRKGGSEIVKALVELRKDFDVEAFLIGKFTHVDYASSWEVDSADEMRKLFLENESWLHHFEFMPNSDVIALAKTCHIGLLPTRHDTFGYSVLEFQACGLPCITTDICALPEVNNDEIGWLLNVPKLSNDGVDLSSADKIHELSKAIEFGLVMKLREALSNVDSVREKGVLAITNIRNKHSVNAFGQRLCAIYEEALA